MGMNRCSALVGQAYSSNGVCTNGFVTLPACDPIGEQPRSCWACGRPRVRQSKPLCMRENEPAPTWDQVLRSRARAALLQNS